MRVVTGANAKADGHFAVTEYELQPLLKITAQGQDQHCPSTHDA
jgi:hypothetical protein